MSILYVGSTGLVGMRATLGLRSTGNSVVTLARMGRNNPKAADLMRTGIEVVEGDLGCPETLRQALRGKKTVICSATSMPAAADDGLRRIDHDGTLALIELAEAAGVSRFVYVSFSGNLRMPSPLETAKRACENRLLKSAMQVIILRPSIFMEVWLSPALGFDPRNGFARIYGSGESKVSYISAKNVADFVAFAGTTDFSDKNTVLELGGPESISQLDAVRIFERVLGKEIRLEYVPTIALETQYNSPDPLQKTFAALSLEYSKGDIIEGTAALAEKFGFQLLSVSDYANAIAGQGSRPQA